MYTTNLAASYLFSLRIYNCSLIHLKDTLGKEGHTLWQRRICDAHYECVILQKLYRLNFCHLGDSDFWYR